jgi:crotonobetainyl-CoA:carnitine CoA-transferase CaiB-like acyl-CoA transferase
VKQQGPSIKLSNTPAQFRSFATVPGENTDDTLSNLGYSVKDIEALKDEGAVS